MNKQEYIDLGADVLLNTYNRFPIVLEKGEGVYLYDTDGKKYLDFGAGIAVFALGYNNQEYNDALKQQIDMLLHTSNLFYNPPALAAAKKLKEASGLEKVFLTNSGTEAVEGAVKLARKYGYLKGLAEDGEIIAMASSFHGRSLGALSVTGNDHYREAYKPLLGTGIKFAQYNDLKSVEDLVTDKTYAIILETVQGEGGIYPGEEAFVKGIRKLCDEKDIILILDEIQCGMGRTGTMFAYQQYGIKPDILTTAKALGCGVPVGAFIAGAKVSAAMVPGDHGTTYGGNPFAGAAINIVFELFEKEEILAHVKAIAPYLEKKLDELAEKHDAILERRGKGLMQGLAFDKPVGEIIKKALDAGLILIPAGKGDVIRFVPPLIIEETHIDEMLEKLTACL